MTTNDILHQSVERAMQRGESENRAWYLAYMDLVNEGVLTNPYIAIDDDGLEVETFYIFAHSTIDNQDYTYISAKYRDSYVPISINLYDKFYDYLINAIDTDIEDTELKQDMLDGLSMVFADICEGYVHQLKDEMVDRIKINSVPADKQLACFDAMMKSLKDMFNEYNVKHLDLCIEEAEGNIMRGTFNIKDITVDSKPIFWDVNKTNNTAIIHF